jgi:hypothetical protein
MIRRVFTTTSDRPAYRYSRLPNPGHAVPDDSDLLQSEVDTIEQGERGFTLKLSLVTQGVVQTAVQMNIMLSGECKKQLYSHYIYCSRAAYDCDGDVNKVGRRNDSAMPHPMMIQLA